MLVLYIYYYSQKVEELESLVKTIDSDVTIVNEALNETDQNLVNTSENNGNIENYLTKVHTQYI